MLAFSSRLILGWARSVKQRPSVRPSPAGTGSHQLPPHARVRVKGVRGLGCTPMKVEEKMSFTRKRVNDGAAGNGRMSVKR